MRQMTVIASLPYTISTPGYYSLGSNFTPSNANFSAITINCDNVCLDFNGYVIDGSSAGVNSISHGIYFSQRKNIYLMNPRVVGFLYGIRINDNEACSNGHHVIKGGILVNNLFRGIRIDGTANVVDDCQVLGVAGCTFFANAFAMGIEATGPSARVGYCSVAEVYPQGTGEAVGISISNSGLGTQVYNNKISNKTLPENSFGIWCGSSSKVILEDNHVISMDVGIATSSGVTGAYRDNLTSGCNTPYIISGENMIDAGNNQ